MFTAVSHSVPSASGRRNAYSSCGYGVAMNSVGASKKDGRSWRNLPRARTSARRWPPSGVKARDQSMPHLPWKRFDQMLCGAVSAPVARAMAMGVRLLTGADIAVAVTGLAGPDGDDRGNPVGTVFVAVAGAGGVRGVGARLVGGRDEVRAGTVRMALELLREVLTPG